MPKATSETSVGPAAVFAGAVSLLAIGILLYSLLPRKSEAVASLSSSGSPQHLSPIAARGSDHSASEVSSTARKQELEDRLENQKKPRLPLVEQLAIHQQRLVIAIAEQEKAMKRARARHEQLAEQLRVPENLRLHIIPAEVARTPSLKPFLPYYEAVNEEKWVEANRLAELKEMLAAHSAILMDAPEGSALEFEASATVEFKASEGTDAEEVLRRYLPKDDSSVRLVSVGVSGLWTISVVAEDPQVAAKRATDVAAGLANALDEPDQKRLVLWERPEPSLKAKLRPLSDGDVK